VAVQQHVNSNIDTTLLGYARHPYFWRWGVMIDVTENKRLSLGNGHPTAFSRQQQQPQLRLSKQWHDPRSIPIGLTISCAVLNVYACSMWTNQGCRNGFKNL